MLCHLLAFAGLVIPLGSIVGPLVVWLLKREDHPFIDDQGRESLNFQISMLIYTIVAAILVFVLIGVLLLLALFVFWFVMVIIASINANSGVAYRYPLNLRLIR